MTLVLVNLSLLVLVPFTLTLFAWRSGLRVVASAGESKAGTRARVWPAMLLLAGPAAVILTFVCLRVGHVDMVVRTKAAAWLLFIGAFSSVSALITSTWAPRGFRQVALFAAVAWTACFVLAFAAVAALSGLR